VPAIKYTAREVRSGLLFWAFAEKRSAAASALFAARIQQHLSRCGVSLRDLVWQTDNGGKLKGDFPDGKLDAPLRKRERQLCSQGWREKHSGAFTGPIRTSQRVITGGFPSVLTRAPSTVFLPPLVFIDYPAADS
jgi:hypothetical protein